MTKLSHRHQAFAMAAATLGLAPTAAQAHLAATGMGPIYDGVTHFALSPEDFLPVVALAFFVGLRGPRQARITLATLALSWFIGGFAALQGLVVHATVVLAALTSLLFLAIGGALAANAKFPAAVSVLAAAGLGAVRGSADFVGVPESLPNIVVLLGICASVFAVFAIATSVTLPLHRLWAIVAARVSGSWLAALGLLLAGWIWRYGALVS
jgi:hypothetical protein